MLKSLKLMGSYLVGLSLAATGCSAIDKENPASVCPAKPTAKGLPFSAKLKFIPFGSAWIIPDACPGNELRVILTDQQFELLNEKFLDSQKTDAKIASLTFHVRVDKYEIDQSDNNRIRAELIHY